MYRDIVHAAFLDELEKLSEVSLAGISHEAVQRMASPAPPMETAGLSKALNVMNRYDQMRKVAFLDRVNNPDLPHMQRVTGVKKRKKNQSQDVAQQTGSAAAHTLGGMGAGRMLADFSHGPTYVPSEFMHGRRWKGMAAGGTIGALTYAAKRLSKHRAAKKLEKKAALVGAGTPKQLLRFGRQTGLTQGHGLKSGPSIGRLATKI